MNPEQEISALRNAVQSLAAEVAALKVSTNKAQAMRPTVFVAIEGATDGTFTEAQISASGSALETPADGRRCNSASHYAKLITPSDLDENALVVLEVRYAGGHRYVAIRGGAPSTSSLVEIDAYWDGSGENGSNDTGSVASWGYDVYLRGAVPGVDDPLDTGVQPAWTRQKGATVDPSVAIAIEGLYGKTTRSLYIEEQIEIAPCTGGE